VDREQRSACSASVVAIIAGFAILGLLGCASDPAEEIVDCAASGPAAPTRFSCSTNPVCEDYLDSIRKRVYQSWRPTRPLPRRGAVRIRFRVDETGRLSCAELADTTRESVRGLGTSCLATFRGIEFPELPASLQGLANVDLETVFRYERAY